MNRYTTKALLIASSLFITLQLLAQNPKLVVGVVVDQMRFDHLTRYQSKYGEDGFNRLLKEGYNFKNTHFNYIPTVTASGHASIYSGATPSAHGIIGNSWYDRKKKDIIDNVVNYNYKIVGSKEANTKGKSPHHLMTSTIADELRLGTNFKSKVISVSLKDRGAIYPGGHAANAAYWHDYETSPGYFVSSDYYLDTLPEWVSSFNNSDISDKYLDTVWNTLYPLETYTESVPDVNSYERKLSGKLEAEFPYDIKFIKEVYKRQKTEYHLLWETPMGNTLLVDFAKAAIQNEALGKDEITDMLCISFSVTDVAGHRYGPQSVEIQDIYLRLDKDIAELLTYLDETVGKDEYILFLTSDHAAISTVSFLHDHKLPAALAEIDDYEQRLSTYLSAEYGKPEWVEYFGREQVYFNHELIKEKKIDLAEMQQKAASFLLTLEGISVALTATQLQFNEYTEGIKGKLQNGFNIKRSGDILLSYDPGYFPNVAERTIEQVTGTDHSSGHSYDSHVPLLWFGTGIPNGESARKVHPTYIAPTLSAILNLQMPSSTDGHVLLELWENKE